MLNTYHVGVHVYVNINTMKIIFNIHGVKSAPIVYLHHISVCHH